MDLHISQVLVVFTFVLLNKVISVLLCVFSSKREISWFQFLMCWTMSVAKRRVWVCSVCLQRLYVRVERALVQTGGSAGVWWILERMLSTLRAGHALSGGSRRGQPLYRQGSPSSVAGDGDYSRAVRRAAWFSMCRRTTVCVCLSVGFAYLCGEGSQPALGVLENPGKETLALGSGGFAVLASRVLARRGSVAPAASSCSRGGTRWCSSVARWCRCATWKPVF